jgi:pimeloyl-ACP methyl ester carboxylesterase
MATVKVDGVKIAYELHGEGDPVVITPGGRYGKDAEGIRELAQELAEAGKQALIWDRPNTGESDVCFDRGFEPIMQADALAGLIRTLGLGPTKVIGGSNGGRVSMLTAGRHPELVESLVLLWLSSGDLFQAMLSNQSYCGNAWRAATQHGMQAVIDLADQDGPNDWPTRPDNPENRERMLAMDPKEFADLMVDWGWKWLPRPDSPLPAMDAEDYEKVKAPTLIFNTSPTDHFHPRWTSEAVHAKIPGSRLVEQPFEDEEWNNRMAEFLSTGKHVHFRSWRILVPHLLPFWDEVAAAG